MIVSARSDIYTVDSIRVSVSENNHGQAIVTLQDPVTGLLIFSASQADELYAAICRAREDFGARRAAL